MSAPIRTLSPDRRELWVERIFARMAAMYGRLFADMWAGADLADGGHDVFLQRSPGAARSVGCLLNP